MTRPNSPAAVAANSEATSAWANDVVDGINAILDDIYGAAVGAALAIPWASITGAPATYAPSAHAASHAAAGADAVTPAAIGAWKKDSAGGGAAGGTIWVGTTDPAGAAAEGDIWVKG